MIFTTIEIAIYVSLILTIYICYNIKPK